MTQRGPEFCARHGTPGISSLADADPVPREASPSPANAKIISNLGSPFGSLTIISSSEKQWAQQGSNLRPLACKASSYRRWTWLDVARRGIHQPCPWLDVAWHGLVSVVVGSPFGSPASLAPLTFSKHERQPQELATPWRPQERSMTVSPRPSREAPGKPPGDTSTQRRSVQARVQVGLSATARAGRSL
jgi:hypothetical protein